MAAQQRTLCHLDAVLDNAPTDSGSEEGALKQIPSLQFLAKFREFVTLHQEVAKRQQKHSPQQSLTDKEAKHQNVEMADTDLRPDAKAVTESSPPPPPPPSLNDIVQQALTIVLNLFYARVAPRRYWVNLLAMAVPMLELGNNQCVLGVDDTHVLMDCLEEVSLHHRHSKTVTKLPPNTKVEVIRQILLRNISRAIKEEQSIQFELDSV